MVSFLRMSRLAVVVWPAFLALAVAACATTGEIDGHKIRGTATPETPVEQAAREFNEQMGKIVGDVYGDDPKVQAALRELRSKEDSSNLHAHAPAGFKRWWADYLDQSDGQYAVLAVDRNMRGAGMIRCGTGDCHRANLPQVKAVLDVHYKHGALKLCRENVRENHPAEKPDCAIYAIKDKIVWKSRMPWE